MKRNGAGNHLNENDEYTYTGDWRIDVGSCVFYNLFYHILINIYSRIIMEYHTRSSFDYHKVMRYLIQLYNIDLCLLSHYRTSLLRFRFNYHVSRYFEIEIVRNNLTRSFYQLTPFTLMNVLFRKNKNPFTKRRKKEKRDCIAPIYDSNSTK